MAKYQCKVCKHIYHEEKEGKKWAGLPDNWVCPVCGAARSVFEPAVEQNTESETPPVSAQARQKGGGGDKIICKVCGYIMVAGFTGEICPACGVTKKAFLPYVDNVSIKRRRILDFHIHNVLVHFPQAFAVFMLFLSGMVYFLTGTIKAEFTATVKILAIFLPLSVLVSIVSGLIDGKSRFKRLDTPVLKKKILVGALFFIFSGVLLVLLNFLKLQSLAWEIPFALTGLCTLCSLFLGYNGGRLSGNIVTG